ncbi:AAA family ATPase [Cereibacter changlensis JA139]|uniref:AAA family ATPase n=2 Tax=Cereibacter changlensis TaxID=402884 RepID=A0A2T4JPX1_9RHOB|nr:AAA family ATPase [Cereibacter changlensis]PTE19969.1 AAA family ATPase [Cereibacter changlensis JA139]PZX46877.1 ATP-dependent Zn protease [Cereibacter changlensis]
MTHNTNTTPRPAWSELARQTVERMRRLIATGAERNDPLEPDRSEKAVAAAAPLRKPLDMLRDHPDIMHMPAEDWHAILDAGGDPYATSETGAVRPASPLPASRLLLALRLAATFGSTEGRDHALRHGGVTVIRRVPAADLSSVQEVLANLLPEGWRVVVPERNHHNRECSLLLATPSLFTGELKGVDLFRFHRLITDCFEGNLPMVILLPDTVDLPTDFPRHGYTDLTLAPISADILLAQLAASHSATGRVNEAAIRQALPEDSVLATLPRLTVLLALRAPTAPAAARQLARSCDPHRSSGSQEPRLEDMAGDGPALVAARQLVGDLKLWQKGEIGWSDLSRSLLLYGPPGTGKSWLAQAMGNSAGISVVTASFATWQASGHLGDMLREMHRSFAEARSRVPALLLIDEIDSVGSRTSGDLHNSSYRMQVINAFLAAMDGISREEGVIVVGTCNHPELMDPAILRPGRFDLKIEMPLPDVAALIGVMRRNLPFPEADLQDLAQRAAGLSSADVDAAIRDARARARWQGRDLSADDLRRVFGNGRSPDLDFRVAVHECGHAILCEALQLGQVRRILLTRGGGETHIETAPQAGLLPELEATLARIMAGRAAERVIFGSMSAGAGGSDSSDLAQATRLALSIDNSLGLGSAGPVWLGNAESMLLHDTALRARVRRLIEAAEERAVSVLSAHQPLLEAMARELASVRDFGPADSAHWLARLHPADRSGPEALPH